MLRSLVWTAFLLIALLRTIAVLAATASASTLVDSTTALTTATSITVTTTADEVNSDGDCSLREAIEAANRDASVDGCPAGNGGDILYLPGGLYRLSSGQLVLTNTLTLQGSATDTAILDGNHQDRVIEILPGAVVILLYLDIRNGRVPRPDHETDIRGDGGGIRNGGTTWIAHSTIHNNQAGYEHWDFTCIPGGNGGGISNYGILTVTNSTISGNSAGDGSSRDPKAYSCATAGEGGGISGFGAITLEYTTVTNNAPGKIYHSDSIETGELGGVHGDAVLTAKNSIIAGNQGHDCGGSITSLGHNLLQTIDGCTINGEFTQWAAYLGPLADNGGPTLTHVLYPSSPAIDAGDCIGHEGNPVTVDQRGELRPQGTGCDIGAYESPFTATFAIGETHLPLALSPPCIDFSPMCNLTRTPEFDGSPAWSPDGQKIAFTRPNALFESPSIYLMNADGSDRIKIAEPGDRPLWSPDGSKILFNAFRQSFLDVYVVDADGSRLANLTNSMPDNEFNPAWSPDGSKILYLHTDGSCCPDPELYIMNADGSQKTPLATTAYIPSSPWLPDGKILFADRDLLRGQGGGRLYLVNSDGTNRTEFTLPLPAGGFPVWSPDGKWIAFACIYEEMSDICLMKSDGSQVTSLTMDAAVDFPPVAWSPDSNRLLFRRFYPPTDNNTEIAVINTDGSGLTRLTDISLNRDFYVGEEVWAPDSRKIAFVSNVSGNQDIYLLAIEE